MTMRVGKKSPAKDGNEEILALPVESLDVHELKLRPLNGEIVDDLAQSFKSKGQQEPILVVKAQGLRYRVVFGEHRLEAAKRAGLKTVLCRVREDIDAATELELKITENIHRNNFVDPVVEGQVFSELLKSKYDGDLSKLAEAIGKKVQYISERTRIYHQLAPELKPLVAERRLTVGNAIALSKIDQPKKQVELANEILGVKEYMRMGWQGGSGYGNSIESQRRATLKCVCPRCGNRHDSQKDVERVDVKANEEEE